MVTALFCAPGTTAHFACTSKRGVKGTRFLLEAADRLRREGVQFDLELVENLPHAKARQRYGQPIS